MTDDRTALRQAVEGLEYVTHWSDGEPCFLVSRAAVLRLLDAPGERTKLIGWAAALVRLVCCPAPHKNRFDTDIAQPIRRIALEMRDHAYPSAIAQGEETKLVAPDRAALTELRDKMRVVADAEGNVDAALWAGELDALLSTVGPSEPRGRRYVHATPVGCDGWTAKGGCPGHDAVDLTGIPPAEDGKKDER